MSDREYWDEVLRRCRERADETIRAYSSWRSTHPMTDPGVYSCENERRAWQMISAEPDFTAWEQEMG